MLIIKFTDMVAIDNKKHETVNYDNGSWPGSNFHLECFDLHMVSKFLTPKDKLSAWTIFLTVCFQIHFTNWPDEKKLIRHDWTVSEVINLWERLELSSNVLQEMSSFLGECHELSMILFM